MHDVLWPESVRWEDTVVRFAALAEGAGYGLALTPIVEHEAVFNRGIGEKSEVVGKEMYVFEDRDGQLMALRPEGTASVARAFVQHHPVPPWKAWYVAPLFRHERPQQGRYRQHYQLGVEALGVADADLDVEVVALAHDFFAGLGLRQVTLKLHSMGDGVCKPGYVALLGEFLARPGRPALPGPPGPPPGEPAARPRLQDTRVPGGHRGRAALPRPPLRRLRRPLRPGAPGARRARASPTPSTTAWSAASTTTPAPRSSSPPRRSTPPRTGLAAAAATTAWSRCSGAIRRPGIGFGIGIERVLLACDAEGVFSDRGRGGRPAPARLRDRHRGRHRGGGPDRRAAPGRVAGRPGLRGPLHEVPDQIGRPLGRAGRPGPRAQGARVRHRSGSARCAATRNSGPSPATPWWPK